MIQVEGYKAFHGDMRIVPKNIAYPSFCIYDKDWLYKPDTNCWYADGRSFPAEVCQVISTTEKE